MFLFNLTSPRILMGSSGGGGGGGGGSSSSKKRTPTPAPKPQKYSAAANNTARGIPNTKGRNLDADMAAGSNYAPTKNAGTAQAKQYTHTGGSDGPSRKLVPLTSDTPINSKTSVSAKDLASGNVTTFKAKTGTGSITVARGTKFEDVPTVNVGVNGNKTVSNADTYNSTDVASPPKTSPVTPTTSTGTPTPVTAPKTIKPQDGVGGGRDGGDSGKSKASKADEDKLKIKRKAEGVKGYKRKKSSNPMTIKQGN